MDGIETFNKEELKNLTTGEFNYALYNEEKHKEMFDELNLDEDYNLRFYNLEKRSMEYRDKETKYSGTINVIVEQNDYPVGLLELVFEEKQVIVTSVIRPSARDLGIKKLLVLDLSQYLYENGVEEMLFVVSKYNKANIKSLTSLGVGEYTRKEAVNKLPECYKRAFDKKNNLLYILETDMVINMPKEEMQRKLV